MVFLRLPLTARCLAVLLAAQVAGQGARAQSWVEVSPFDEQGNLSVQLIGRYEVTDVNPDHPDIIFDAPSFEIAFTVSNVTAINITLQQQYPSPVIAEGLAEERPAATGIPDCADTGFQPHTFTVYVDGTKQGPVPGSSCSLCTFDTGIFGDTVQTPNQYSVASGLNMSQSHEIRIIKDSEADFNNCQITYENYLTLSRFDIFGPDGAEIALPSTAEWTRPKIEFIGDSRMTGMCNLCHETISSDPMSVYGSSASESWPKKMCDELDADCHMSTWGGLGLLNTHGEDLDLATLWRREVMTKTESARKEWRADVVIIGVGIDDDLDLSAMTDNVSAFWEHQKEVLLNFTVEVRQANNRDTVILFACLPAFPTSADVFCRAIADMVADVRKLPDKDERVGHAAVFDARGFLTNQNACCGLPDINASVLLAKEAISACNAEIAHTCVHSKRPAPPTPPAAKKWWEVNPPLVSFIFVGFGVFLLCVCALYVGGAPDLPCNKKVDPEAATQPLAAGR